MELWYFASRDADVSGALSFFWAKNVLWTDELEGQRVGVIVRGDYQGWRAEKGISSKGEMSRWREKDSLEVLFYPDFGHAMVSNTKERRPVLDIVHQFVRLCISEAARVTGHPISSLQPPFVYLLPLTYYQRHITICIACIVHFTISYLLY